jgi:uncharacterized membrane protein
MQTSADELAQQIIAPPKKASFFDSFVTEGAETRRVHSFFQTTEGIIFLIGCMLLGIELFVYFTLFHEVRALRQKLIAIIVADLVGGRGASLSVGLDLELAPFAVVLVSVLFNLTLLLMGYPLVLTFYERLVEMRFIGKAFRTTRKMAEENQEKIERWGVVGLAFFVWLPVHSTGAFIGAIIGRLLGMRTITAVVTAALAMAASAVSWAYTFDHLFELGARAGKILPSVFVVFFLGFAVFRHLRSLAVAKRRGGSSLKCSTLADPKLPPGS